MTQDTGTVKKLGVISLAALVISAMVGGGIFSLPQNMGQSAGVWGTLIAWVITGTGVFFIANTFRVLADVRPDATTGIYAYARLGFGKFTGFQIAWAYWLCNIFGNVGYAVMLMDAMDYFFPGTFTGGNNLWSIIGGSFVIWLMNFIVLSGVRQATFINNIGTIAKLLPILLCIIILLFTFSWATFSFDMSAQELIPTEGIKPLGSLWSQITGCMLVTLWAFIGIEGAVVISGRARSQKDVGKATLLGFLGCLLIYILLSLLPFGQMHQEKLAALANPSTAPLLQSIVGTWGGLVMNVGVIIALLTSWLAFTIMIAQIPYAAAQDGTFPQIFAKENRNSSPSVSLWVTSFCMQLTMILVYFASNAWNSMLSITSIMIVPPYMACTAYLWKMCVRGEYPNDAPVKKVFAWIYSVFGTLFCIWMLYSGGLNYVMMAFIFFALGIPFYIWARRDVAKKENTPNTKIFNKIEYTAMIVIIIVALCALVYIGNEIWKTDEPKVAKTDEAIKSAVKTPAHRTKISDQNKHISHTTSNIKLSPIAEKIEQQ